MSPSRCSIAFVNLLMAMLGFNCFAASAGEITRHSFFSEVLDREYAYLAYRPDGYDSGIEPYPVAYLLHGSTSSETTWTEYIDVEPILDELIESGAIPPSLVIMPGSLSWWADGANEPAATAFIEDLIPHIDDEWRTFATPETRVIGGISAGGFGTVTLAMRHPDMFVSAIALSPATYSGLPPEVSSAWVHPTFQSAEGEFDDALWHNLNYENLIEDYLAQPMVVPFYINSGDHDPLDIAYHAAILFHKLRPHQPEQIEFRVVDGGHERDVWVSTLPEALEFAFSFVDLDTETTSDCAPQTEC